MPFLLQVIINFQLSGDYWRFNYSVILLTTAYDESNPQTCTIFHADDPFNWSHFTEHEHGWDRVLFEMFSLYEKEEVKTMTKLTDYIYWIDTFKTDLIMCIVCV